MALLSLPTDKDELVAALNQAESSSEAQRNLQQVEWKITYYYLQGVRAFRVINYQSGSVQVAYDNKAAGDLRFEDVLVKLQSELGRLMRMDTSPVAKPDGFGLDSLRRAAISQAVLTHQTAALPNDQIKLELLLTTLLYGTAGLGAWHQSQAGLATDMEIEVIPPWELGCCPADPKSLKDITAYLRTRWVPLKWLKKLATSDGQKLTMPRDEAKLDVREVAYGANPNAAEAPGGSTDAATSVPATNSDVSRPASSRRTDTERYVKLTETWVLGPCETVSRYVIKAGNAIVFDADFEKMAEQSKEQGQEFVLPALPIGIARYYYTGGFFGRAYVAPQIPMARKVEAMLTNLFKNIEDLDWFGFLMVPMSMGATARGFKQTERPRVVAWEPDYSVPEAKPFKIEPTNVGDFPGKVAQLGTSLLDRLANQPSLLSGDAPGRVDSAAGLGFAWETSSVPLGVVANSVAAAYKTVYKAILGMSRSSMGKDALLSMTTLDESVAGVVYDVEKGGLALADNPIPLPSQVRIDIRDKQPRFIQQRIQQIFEMLKAGLITPRQFRLISYREQLDLPVGDRAELENYRKAIFNVVLLFNDGKTPGKAIVNTAIDNPEIHLMVISDFMAKPEFMLAEQPVRQAFENLKAAYEAQMGNFPAQLPYPEDMPVEQAALQKIMAQMGGGAGPSGPIPQASAALASRGT